MPRRLRRRRRHAQPIDKSTRAVAKFADCAEYSCAYDTQYKDFPTLSSKKRLFSGELTHLRIHISPVARFGTMKETVVATRNISALLSFAVARFGTME